MISPQLSDGLGTSENATLAPPPLNLHGPAMGEQAAPTTAENTEKEKAVKPTTEKQAVKPATKKKAVKLLLG